MRRIRNLAIFGVVAIVVLLAAGFALRQQLGSVFGVNPDAGPGGEATLTLPDGYEATVFANGLASPRFMAVSPDGVIVVAERGRDRIVALPDADGDGRADEVVEVGAGYGSAHSVAFTADGELIVGGEEAIYAVTLDGLHEADRHVLVDGLPGGGHSTKTVAVLPGGDVLVSIGSSCNVCDETDARRATIQLLSADGEMGTYMRGVRNAVGLWVDPDTDRPWATVMGRDLIGDDRPPETLYEVVDGADAGWPRCHAGSIVDPDFGTGSDPCDGVVEPAATFPAHTAPLALLGWDGHLMVALHGSWNSSVKVGYAVWWLPWNGAPAGDPEPFATGFLPDGATDALGRPAGLAVGSDDALYVTDDKAGFVYRVIRSDQAGGG